MYFIMTIRRIGNQRLLDDISKCIVANKYTAQIIENKPHTEADTETDREDVLSSRRESKQLPLCFRAEVMNFGSGEDPSNKDNLATTHVPMIIPIFAPRTTAREKRRKFTATEEGGARSEARAERPCSALGRTQVQKSAHRLFEEFFIVGVPTSRLLSTTLLKAEREHPHNLFQFPNLPQTAGWYIPGLEECSEKRRILKEFCFPNGVLVHADADQYSSSCPAVVDLQRGRPLCLRSTGSRSRETSQVNPATGCIASV